MSIAIAPNPWFRPASTPGRWRFAQQWHDGDASAGPTLQWRLLRQGSFAGVRVLAIVAAALAAVSLGIGLGFWWLGAPAVLPFAGAEVALLGAAFWVCRRHADDAEIITLRGRTLRVQCRCGRSLQQADFRAEWVRVEPLHGEASLIELSGQGRQMRVGRWLRPEWRGALAREIRLGLRLACNPGPTSGPNGELQR